MLTHTEYHQGLQEHIDYNPVAETAAGAIVLFAGSGTRYPLVGIALIKLAAAKDGALCISGIFRVRKKATITFAMGAAVGWDAAGINANGTGEALASTGRATDIGVCVKAAAANDDWVLTKINFFVSDAV